MPKYTQGGQEGHVRKWERWLLGGYLGF